MDKKRFPKIIENIYKNVAELEKMFPGRPFTPDGHMVGSIGECIAAHYYDLNIVPPSNKGYDAVRRNLKVEIKATQAKRISLRSEPQHFEKHLMRLKTMGKVRQEDDKWIRA